MRYKSSLYFCDQTETGYKMRKFMICTKNKHIGFK